VLMFSLLGATISYVYAKRINVLAGVVVICVMVGALLSNDPLAVGIIGGCVAVAGALGLLQDRRDAVLLNRDNGASIDEPPSTISAG